ncbi:hypothetical protein [Burkholderia phage BCSR52]|uniref:Uncharacterized protein n=1 Tax=Burkholderia phage BCSR52 TaxID=2805748 RepID=A0A889IRU1_9CAUD|nr:hypothetical protein [Burkholderia phage BCSR52]
MSKRYIVRGVNDDKDFCECCGRKGLKRVVWIEDTETQEMKHFGTTCAVQPTKGFDVDADVKYAVRQHQNREKEINRMAYFHYKKLGGKHVKSETDPNAWRAADPELYAKARAEMTIEVDKFYNSFKVL